MDLVFLCLVRSTYCYNMGIHTWTTSKPRGRKPSANTNSNMKKTDDMTHNLIQHPSLKPVQTQTPIVAVYAKSV